MEELHSPGLRSCKEFFLMPQRVLPLRTVSRRVPGSPKINGFAVLNTVQAGPWAWDGGGVNDFHFFSSLLRCVSELQSCSSAGGISKWQDSSAGWWMMLAAPFPGMLAPTTQVESFAPANCDFRTQVCSWTWTPSCQRVAICHQHMAP